MRHPIRQGDIPGVQLRYDKGFDLPPELLWLWLTEPERMSRWLSADVEPRAGGAEGWILRDTDELGEPLIEEARRLVVEEEAADEGRLWVAAFERKNEGWRSATRLSFEIWGDGPCELSVLQQGFERLSLSSCLTVWELYRRRWRLALDRLESALRSEGA